GIVSAGAADGGASRSHLGLRLCADRWGCGLRDAAPERPAIPHHPPLPDAGLRGARVSPAGAGAMAVIGDVALQGLQMLLVLSLSPLLTGFVRKVKARLLRRSRPPRPEPHS